MTTPAPTPLPAPSGVKAGWKTTEFYVTVATEIGLIAASSAGWLPPKYAALGTAVSGAAYAFARGLAKLSAPKGG